MIPCYRGQSTLHMYAAIKADVIAFLGRVQREAGDFVRVPLPVRGFIFVNDAALVHEALTERSEDLILQGGAVRGLARLIGHGILTNCGENWQRSRSNLQPLFRRRPPDEAAAIIRELTAETLAHLQARPAGAGTPLSRDMVGLSFRIVYGVLFGSRPSVGDAEEFAAAMAVLQSDGMARHVAGTDVFGFLPTARNRRLAGAKATLRRLAQTVAGSDRASVDDIISLGFAGAESPANTLCWTIWLLQQHREWLERLQQSPDDEQLRGQVLSESLRLYPAGWAFERFAVRDTTIGGEHIPAGSRLVLSPYLLHRNPRYWPNPLQFEPRRFRDGLTPAADAQRLAYIPFGAGPRSCIGSRLAWLQMQIILGEVVRAAEWTIEDDPTEPLFAVGSFKLRPSFPLKAKLHWRAAGCRVG